ncbi:hypothetical protein EYF80_040891 [Liparis tanakae]|uniref:Uncharacterized protein n=1 Tax=Liparis tanakae TaxID=230148 RepID=A0A4Z2G5W7_9TELE|nr:hypothetical protein EYF80_040891 [Liparis tanakae]
MWTGSSSTKPYFTRHHRDHQSTEIYSGVPQKTSLMIRRTAVQPILRSLRGAVNILAAESSVFLSCRPDEVSLELRCGSGDSITGILIPLGIGVNLN